jgi:Putative peptidoglycan binding domain
MARVATLTILAIALAPLYAAPQHLRPSGKKSSSSATGKAVSSASPHHAAATNRPMLTKTSARTSLRVAASTRSAPNSAHGVRNRLARANRAVHVAPAPSYQLHPDPARYQEIQRALADRGYFKGEPTGEWKDDSVDALRRFQADQKIDNDGKIDSLSLIGLGLGPKHKGIPSPPETASSNPSPIQPSITSGSGTR